MNDDGQHQDDPVGRPSEGGDLENALRELSDIEAPVSVADAIATRIGVEQRVVQGWQGRWLFAVPLLQVIALAALRNGRIPFTGGISGFAVAVRNQAWEPMVTVLGLLTSRLDAALRLAFGPLPDPGHGVVIGGIAVAVAAVTVALTLEKADA